MNIKKKKIRVLIVEPKKEPYVRIIYNSLVSKQKIVGELVEFVELENNVDLICNDTGKLDNLEMNRIIKNDVICGTFIVAGQQNGYTISLTDDQIKKYKDYFNWKKNSLSIELLKIHYGQSSKLLNYDLTGVEMLKDIKF